MEQSLQMIRIVSWLMIICCIPLATRGYAMPYSINATSITNVSGKIKSSYAEATNNDDITWHCLATIDVDSLRASDSLQIHLDEVIVNVHNKYSNDDTNGHYVHYSSSENDIDVYLYMMDNCVVGNINTHEGRYALRSVSPNHIAIIRHYESSAEEDPEIHEEENYNDTTRTISSTTLPIRVLFLYTDSVRHMMGTYKPDSVMRSIVFMYINQGNESFNNSSVNARFQLAYIGLTTYNEATQTWSNVLNHFCGKNDGYMDEVHTLRDKYSADVCVLLQGKNDYCGEARTINASENTAFCIVAPLPVCNSKFSAIHEIGHLVGCRHNRSADGANTPYKYGHGYYHYDENNYWASWRTMMSYDNSCQYGCPRILYWSNPYVSYDGLPTGTVTYENNARVWSERAGTIAAFRSEEDSVVLTAANNNSDAIYENITARVIETKLGFEILDGQTVEMRASTIRLMFGTTIHAGAKFRAIVYNDFNNYPQFAPQKDFVTENKPMNSLPSSTMKILHDGQIYIRRDGKTYRLDGRMSTFQ